ncbi:hypothetical protein FACS1894204_13150 [Synergistales bacterium]|nr:hypothetical protein FACS1894204_13150 [Synergistales bacterium]
MRPVSYVITNFIEKTMNAKGLNLFVTSDGKYLIMDGSFETMYKFDLTFSDSDFSCQILAREGNNLNLKKAVNIPWTNGKDIRDFMEFIRNL